MADVSRWPSGAASLKKLLKRVFDLDLEHCPNYGGRLKIIAAILAPPVIGKILTHRGCRRARHPGRRPVAKRCKRLTIPMHQRSGGPQSRATGIGCARGFSGPMDVARRQGLTKREIAKPIIRWEDSPQLGYENLPNKFFYRYQPPTPAKDLLAEFWRLEKEAETMLEGLAK